MQSPDLPLLLDRDTLPFVVGALAGDLGAVAVEASATIDQFHQVRDLRGEPVVLPGTVERLRQVKDDDEIASLERACAITAAALAQLAT